MDYHHFLQMREEQYMLILQRMIEEKSAWGEVEHWTNYNFSLLSDDVKKVTGKRISDSTLKRIFGKKKTKSRIYSPHTYTKNILVEYLGFTNWDEFRKSKRGKEPKKELRTEAAPSKRKRKIITAGILGLIIVVSLVFVVASNFISRNKSNPLGFMECESSTGRIPFTAVFHYELEDTEDSVLIDFGNNEAYFLSPRRNMITQFYPGADYAEVNVTLDGTTLCKRRIHILSDGWQSGFSPSDTVEAYRPFENQSISKAGGRLFIPLDVLREQGISPADNIFVEYRYFDTLDVSLDNLILTTITKNSSEEGGKRCYDIEIILKGENSDFIVRFLEPGCFRYVRFNVGEKRYFGRFHDLSVFARDVSDWRNIHIEIVEGRAKVFFEDELIRTEDYNEKMGEFKGIIYRFFGNGAIDYMKLESGGEVILEDGF